MSKISNLLLLLVIINSALLVIAEDSFTSHGPTVVVPPNKTDEPDNFPKNPPNRPPCGLDPVLLSTGAFYHNEEDLLINSLIDLRFARNYHNQSIYDGPMGYNWNFSLNKKLKVEDNGDVLVYEPESSEVTGKNKYEKNGNRYLAASDCFNLLTQKGEFYHLVEPQGKKWIFDNKGLLVEILDNNGNKLTFEYDSAERLTIIYDDLGLLIDLSYNEDGRISSIKGSGSNAEVHYKYENKNLVEVTKSGGRVTRYKYDSAHNLISIANNRGIEKLKNYYDSKSRVIKQEYNGATAYISYDTDNNCTRVTDWRGYIKDYFFDPVSGEKTKEIQYTANLRPADPPSYTTTYSYNSHGLTNCIQYPDGRKIFYEYDSRGNMIEKREKAAGVADGVHHTDLVTTMTYDVKWNKPSSIIDPRGYETKSVYDDKGNISSVTNALGQTISFEYDQKGRKIKETSPKGVVTKYSYSSTNGYLVQKIVDSGTGNINAETTYSYNGLYLSKLTNPQGSEKKIIRNVYNLPSVIVESETLNIKTNLFYDKDKNIIKIEKVSDQSGLSSQTIDYSYDQRNNVTRISENGSKVTNYTYDAAGHLVEIEDPNDNISTAVYDERGLLWKQTNAEGAATEFSYTLNGDLASLKDAKGNMTTYDYDGFGRVIKTTYPNLSYKEFSYDKNGNRQSEKTRAGDTIIYEYDALNRLITKTTTDTGITTYQYDAVSRLIAVTDNSGTITFSYDTLGRLIKKTDANAKSISYEYDLNGNRTKLIYPDDAFITYQYDELGRNTTISNPDSTAIAVFNYNQLSQLKRVDYENGSFTSYSFNNLGQLVDIKHNLNGLIRDYGYTRDKVGNILTKNDANSDLHTYTYDDIYQVTKEVYPGSKTVNYNFDSLGNRQTVNNNGTTTDYTANVMNQYITVNSQAVSYDTNGNTASYGADSYVYDSENQLIKVTTSNNIIKFSYDAFGNRTEKRVYDLNDNMLNSASYLYDGADVLCEYDVSGTEKARYVLANLDRPIRRTNDNSSNYYYHADSLGSITEISNSAGNLVEAYNYDIYGNRTVEDAIGNSLTHSTIGNKYFFTGRRFEAETNLYYYRARFYSSELGRFLQPDPIEYAGGINIYAYCGNNSVNFVDPMGLRRYGPYHGKTWLDYLKKYHYERNKHQAPGSKKFDKSKLKKENYDFDVPSDYHQHGVPDNSNRKVVSPDGHSEYVYDKNDDLVEDPANKGTYNYYSPDNWFGHSLFDILPYLLWGNSEDDPTGWLDRAYPWGENKDCGYEK